MATLRSCTILAFAALSCRATPPPAPVDSSATPQPPPARAAPAAVDRMLAEIDADRLKANVELLVGFGTRHTLSADEPGRGIAAAREGIAAHLRGSPQLAVTLDSHRFEPDRKRVDIPVDVVNVVATLPGSLPEARARTYYVIGHYDSRVTDPMNRTADAPGANDDASGVAVVMELARVMSQHSYDATIVFMATAGEEQGLLGARRHAAAAAAAKRDIRGVLSNDIVGDPTGPRGATDDGSVRVFSIALDPWLLDEDLDRVRTLAATHDGESRQLARFVAEVGERHELDVQAHLVFRRDRFLRGGDHTAFNEAGFAAVRFSEMQENYDRQHQDVRTEDDRAYGDLPAFVDPTYLRGVARLNAATLAHLANAPSVPTHARIVADALASDTTLRWDRSPEPDTAGYEVVWRDTTEARWSHTQDVGNTTEAVVQLSKDNVFFGVRAYDREGYRSPVRFMDVGAS